MLLCKTSSNGKGRTRGTNRNTCLQEHCDLCRTHVSTAVAALFFASPQATAVGCVSYCSARLGKLHLNTAAGSRLASASV